MKIKTLDGYAYEYIATEDGRIFALKGHATVLTDDGIVTGVELKELGSAARSSSRYRSVSLKLESGEWKPWKVHRLIAQTFLGECPDGQEVIHLDEDAYNCAVDNLAYATHAENMRRFAANSALNNHPTGPRKLTAANVRRIRQLADQGYDAELIHETFDEVEVSTIQNVIDRTTWAWLDEVDDVPQSRVFDE